jgi:hypothetical protein
MHGQQDRIRAPNKRVDPRGAIQLFKDEDRLPAGVELSVRGSAESLILCIFSFGFFNWDVNSSPEKLNK